MNKTSMQSELFYKGNYGLERETLRVDKDGRLATTPHPYGMGQKGIGIKTCRFSSMITVLIS